MAAALARLRRWLTEQPMPSPDADLAAEMAKRADELARAEGFDFSVQGLAVVEERIRSSAGKVSVERFGAYVGEVLRRHAKSTAWARPPGRRRRGDPGIAVGKWLADPFERVQRASAGGGHPDDTLVAYVTELVEYSEEPIDETAARLGWTTVRRGR